VHKWGREKEFITWEEYCVSIVGVRPGKTDEWVYRIGGDVDLGDSREVFGGRGTNYEAGSHSVWGWEAPPKEI